MNFFEFLSFLYMTPPRFWPLLWRMYWRNKDEGVVNMLRSSSPLGPPLWKWLLGQTLLVWSVISLVGYFFGLVPALIVNAGFLGLAHNFAREWELLSHDKMRHTVAIGGWFAATYPALLVAASFVYQIIQSLPAGNPGAGYFWGKLVLVAIILVATPYIMHVVARRLPQSWKTPIWDFRSDGSEKGERLAPGSYRPTWRNDDYFQRDIIGK